MKHPVFDVYCGNIIYYVYVNNFNRLLIKCIVFSRCLNRDHPGQILLHLCVSMLLMNASFLAGGSRRAHAEVCAAVAVLVHYFLLSSLAWMCVEATNMYQLLVHVFASAESHFMLKRSILAWGKILHFLIDESENCCVCLIKK